VLELLLLEAELWLVVVKVERLKSEVLDSLRLKSLVEEVLEELELGE